MSTSKLFGKDILITSTTEASSSTVGTISTLGGINVTKTILTAGGINSVSNTNTLGNIFTTGGNIGIGTTAPTQSLSIVGNLNFTGNLYQNNSVYSGSTQWGSTGANIYFNTGNVGIGTLAPSSTLDVSGTLNASAIVNTSWVPPHTFSNNSTAGATAIASFLAPNVPTNNVGLINIGKSLSVGNSWGFGFNYVGNNNTANSFGINPYGLGGGINMLNNGNVGIGTTNPDSSLHVAGTIAGNPVKLGIHLGIDASGHAAIQLNSTNTSGFAYIDFSSPNVDYGSRIIHDNTNRSLAFEVNGIGGIRPLTLASSGNVGIGTTSPIESLDVRGNLRIGNSTQANYISFFGTNLDGANTTTSSSHTFIGERLFNPTEQSELLIFKGNDVSTGAGPDRIRLLSAEHRFDTFTTSSILAGTFENIATHAFKNLIKTFNPNCNFRLLLLMPFEVRWESLKIKDVYHKENLRDNFNLLEYIQEIEKNVFSC